MPLNGSGGATQPTSSVYPAVPSTLIESAKMNASIADIYSILSSALYKDGQAVATQRVPFAQGISTDSVTERSSGSGVTIDSVLLKDGGATLTSTLTGTAVTLSGALSATIGTFSDVIAANGAAITTDDTTFALLNTTATTINFGGAASTGINFGNASGTNTCTGILSLATGQLKFPATQNASADANTLDDYEEGTFTPSLGGTTTYTTQLGKYTKIGNVVAVSFAVTVNAIGTGSTTTMSGLPFSAAANHGGGFSLRSLSNTATSIVDHICGPALGGSDITVLSKTAAAASHGLNAIFQNTTGIVGTGVYLT